MSSKMTPLVMHHRTKKMMLEDQLDQIGAPRSPADKITSNPFLSIPTSPSQLKSSQQLMKEKIDTLESTILAKAEIKCGFAAEYGKLRHMFHLLRFHDKNNHGYINFPDFLEFLIQFNIVTLQNEAEELFNRYDDDMIGHIDCKEFAMMLYKVPPYNVLSPNSQNTLLTIRQALCGSNEYLGLRYYRAVMRLPSLDGEGLVLKADMNTLLVWFRLCTENLWNNIPSIQYSYFFYAAWQFHN